MKVQLNEVTKKLYQMMIRGFKLTFENMLVNGISFDDINVLLGHNIIKEETDLNFSTYHLVNVSDFRNYGIYLLKGGQVRNAFRCFEVCYELEPNNKEVCMQYLLMQLKKNNYEEVFEAFKKLENGNNVDINFNNLLLYLLNCITKLPEEYDEKVSYFDLENEKNGNQFITFIYDSNFKDAYNLINNILSKNCEYLIHLELIKELIKQMYNKNSDIMESINKSILDKDYKKVVDILRSVQTRRKLTYNEECIILLCDAIVKIKETSIIPKIYETDSVDIYDLIICNNFDKALRKLNRSEKNRNELIHSLLVELNNLIKEVKRNNKKQADSYQENIEDAYGYIFLFSTNGMSIEDGCKKYRLSPVLSLLIRIIDAKDNYDEEKRKAFYAKLRQSDNLPSNVIAFLDEIEKEENVSKEVKVPVKRRYRFRHYDGKKELRTKF